MPHQLWIHKLGVPQDSALDPLLFLIYIDNTPGVKSFFLLFADYLNLIVNTNLPIITKCLRNRIDDDNHNYYAIYDR